MGDLTNRLNIHLSEMVKRVKQGLSAVSPMLFLDICDVFDIDISGNPRIVHQVLNVLSDFTDSHLSLFVEDSIPIPVLELDKRLREISDAPPILEARLSIILCSDCSARSSRIKCHDCNEGFCQNCFEISHVSGKRRFHKQELVSQNVCESCDLELADHLVQENLITTRFCKSCLGTKYPSDQNPRGSPMIAVDTLRCFHCAENPCEVICLDCDDVLCFFCFELNHHRGRMTLHRITAVNRSHSPRSTVPGLTLHQLQVLLDKAKSRSERDSLVPFMNDSMSRCWLECKTRRVIPQKEQ